MGGKLLKEIGAQENMAPRVTIILNSPLDGNKLRAEVIEAVPLALEPTTV
jgi:hypothetical protein